MTTSTSTRKRRSISRREMDIRSRISRILTMRTVRPDGMEER